MDLRRALAALVFFTGCATSRPAQPAASPGEQPLEAAQARLPEDEPSRLLLDFEEAPADPALLKSTNVQAELGPQGATHGKRALKMTVVPGDGSNTNVAALLRPPLAFTPYTELAVDVTNPTSQPELFWVVLAPGDTSDPARRKGSVSVPPGETVTARLVLTGSSKGLLPPRGLVAKASHEIDLSHVRYVLFGFGKEAKPGEQLIVDDVRLIKRDANGVAVAAVRKPKLAVLELKPLSEDMDAKAKLLTTLAFDAASAEKTADVISAADIGELIGVERQKQLLGCTEGACMAELGGAIGSEYVLYGEVGHIGTRNRVDVRLVDSSKAKVLASEGEFVPAGNDDALADATTRLVQKVFAESPLRPQ